MTSRECNLYKFNIYPTSGVSVARSRTHVPVDFFLLGVALQALHVDVVEPAALAVHGDAYAAHL